VKLVRVLSRLALLLLATSAFVGLTEIYASSVRLPLPNPRWQAGRQHRPSAPEITEFPEFVGAGVMLAGWAVAGRRGLRLRLRLSPVSRSEELVLLDLQRRRYDGQNMRDPEVGARNSAIGPA
jgi:hypothetical protein